MFQQHSNDANGRLLRRFYAPLILLSVMDPTRGAQHPDLASDSGSNHEATLWRNFLDQLAFLCDSEKGGDTVTAIAVQKNAEHPIFWLATNSSKSNKRIKAQDHLILVLGLLEQIHTINRPASDVEDDITSQCIDFSHRRIKTYSTWLMCAIRKAKRMMKERTNVSEGTNAFILKEFDRLKTLESNPGQLCSHAYNLRRGRLMEILDRRHHAHSNRGVWSDIRHYLGRLGSWTKAVRILRRGARTFPERFESAQVRVIGNNGPADKPDTVDLTSLNDVVRRMVPAKQTSLVEQLCQALTEADVVAGIDVEFWEHYANIKPRPHAELLVLEHFYHKQLEFTADDRYIGCSKPSCYCCHIYMQCHPGRFSPRPSHGNLWTHWAPPYPLPLALPRGSSNAPRPQDHHTFKMLQAMLIPIRRDLQDQIMSRRPKRAKLPDSTTGISSVVVHDVDVDVDALTARKTVDSYHIQLHEEPSGSIGGASSVSIALQAEGLEDPESSGRSDGEHLDYDRLEISSLKLPITIEYGPDHGERTRSCRGWNIDCESVEDAEDSDTGVLIFTGRKV